MNKDLFKPLIIGILSLLFLGGYLGISEGLNKDLDDTTNNELEEVSGNMPVVTAVDTMVIPVAPSKTLSTALSYSNIDIVWQDNSDNEMAFSIERSAGTTDVFSHLAVVEAVSGSGSNGFYEDSGLLPYTTYCYRIRAYNSVGNSSYSPESCATTKHKPAAIPEAATGTSVNLGLNSVRLTGTVNPNGLVTGAFFQWGASFENSTPLKSVGSSINNVDVSTELTKLALDTTYYYRMVAVTMKGKTVFGAHKSFTTLKLPERIINGSFSSATKGWTLTGDFWAGTNFAKYHTPPGYAAGGVSNTGRVTYNAKGSMYQTVNIPKNATLAVLGFWLNITSKESTITKQRDKLYVEVLDSNNRLVELARYSNLDKTSGAAYSKKSFDLTRYKGREIRIRFRSITDSTSYTVFRIDNVSLMSDG